MNPPPLVYVPMTPIPTKPTATPIIDETTHKMTTVGNEAKEEVSQGIQGVEKECRYRIEEGGSQDKHRMAKANHMNKAPKYDNNGDAPPAALSNLRPHSKPPKMPSHPPPTM